MNQREIYMSGVTNHKYWVSRHSNLLLKFTFLFGIICFLQAVGDGRGSTFDHSARIRPAFTGPYIEVFRSLI